MFSELWDFVGNRFATIVAFVAGEREREATTVERGVARVIDVVANLIFLALLVVLVGKGVHSLWASFSSAGGVAVVRRGVARDPRQILALVGLLLLALAAVLLVIEVLFRLRAYAAPAKLFALWASYQIIRLLIEIATSSKLPWHDIVDALLE